VAESAASRIGPLAEWTASRNKARAEAAEAEKAEAAKAENRGDKKTREREDEEALGEVEADESV